MEEIGIRNISVGCLKKYTSGPNSLCRMIMELPSQEKIPRETKIIRDMDRASKKRYI